MARLSKKALGAMGTAITSEAKRIRKASPKKKWTTCMKEAGAAYKRKHK